VENGNLAAQIRDRLVDLSSRLDEFVEGERDLGIPQLVRSGNIVPQTVSAYLACRGRQSARGGGDGQRFHHRRHYS